MAAVCSELSSVVMSEDDETVARKELSSRHTLTINMAVDRFEGIVTSPFSTPHRHVRVAPKTRWSGRRVRGSHPELVPAVRRWQAVSVRNYGQLCTIARTSELLAKRWSIIILRNILIDYRTFNEIADGAPGLSRGLLSRRLRGLERAGVVEIRPKPEGPGSIYEPTQAGRELWDVMLALQHWGSKWAELTPEHAHPGVVPWSWVRGYLQRNRLPRRRVLVPFEYPTTVGARPPRLAADRTRRRRDLREIPRRRGGSGRRVSDPVAFARGTWGRSSGVTPCAPGRSR